MAAGGARAAAGDAGDWLMSTLSPESISRPVAGFHDGLKEAGYIEGQNVAIEYRNMKNL